MAGGKVFLHLSYEREGFAHIQAPVASGCRGMERLVVLQFIFRVSQRHGGAVTVDAFMAQRYDSLYEALAVRQAQVGKHDVAVLNLCQQFFCGFEMV